MSTPDDIDALAGEYVLGTLDAAERADVAARRAGDPALSAAIRAWERRLAPLDAAMPAVAPPADLFARIERQIDAGQDLRLPLAAATSSSFSKRAPAVGAIAHSPRRRWRPA